MESALLGVMLDSSIVIAERTSLLVPDLIESIQITYGRIEVSLSPVTVAELLRRATVAECFRCDLVHGIYRARPPEASQRRREYIQELVKLVPLHPVTLETAMGGDYVDAVQA